MTACRVRLLALTALAVHAFAGGAFAGLPSGTRAQLPLERRGGAARRRAAAPTPPAAGAEGGEIRVRGLQIKSVDVDKGIIVLSPLAGGPAPAPKAPQPEAAPKAAPKVRPADALELPAPGTEVEGRVTFIGKKRVTVAIGQLTGYELNITTEMISKLRAGEQLSLVVESRKPRVAALTPAAQNELAERTATRKPLSEFEVGMELDGVVKNIQAYGVFVDVHGSTDALARFSGLASGVKGKLKIGNPVRVNVTGVDLENGNMIVSVLSKKEDTLG